MRGVFRVGVCVAASVLALVMVLSTHVETQSGFSGSLLRARAATAGAAAVIEAPAGCEGGSNGCAEEYCQHQDDQSESPNSPQIDDDECSFEAAATEFGGSETAADGVGPVFNATGCGECHIAP